MAGFEFTPPDGDPARLRAAAENFRNLAAHFAQQSTTIRTQAQTALDDGQWEGRNSLRFRAGADGVVAQVGDAATSLGSLAETLTVLAVNLQATIEEIEKYKVMAEHAEAEARHTVSKLDPASPAYTTASGAAHNEGEIAYWNYAGQADKARKRYEQQARSAAGAIDALTNRAVPGGSTLALDQINAAVDASTGLDDLDGIDSLSEAQAWAALDAWTNPDTGVDSLLDGLNVYGATSLSPSAVAQWWSTLTPLQQMAAIRTNPKLGNLDGVAYWARDLANRSMIDTYYKRLQERREELLVAFGSPHLGGPSEGNMLDPVSPEWDLVNDKLASLDAVRDLADEDDHHILGLDLSHERAQAIVAQGDLDTARYVGVLTPGLTSTVQGMGGNVGHMADLRREAARDLRKGMSYADVQAAGGPKQIKKQIATVTWLDYQAPQWNTIMSSNSVLSSHTAQQGGDALADFYRGIHDTRSDSGHSTAHVLAMAHSYGTPTLGYAEQQPGLHINKSLMIESPGPSVRDIKDLHVPRGQSYFVEGKRDLVADAGLFGDDPSHIAGAKHLESGASTDPDSRHHQGSVGHSLGNYLGHDTTTRYNAAKLLIGQTDGLVHGDDRGIGDELRREVPDEW